MAVRGFLRGDMYNALTEIMSRAEGSFGVQVHCTLEPGVVVIASKGQPMSISYDDTKPIVLFGSEAEAVRVHVDKFGNSLTHQLDLDSKGEIMRIGYPRDLREGSCAVAKTAKCHTADGSLQLSSGIEIMSYLLGVARDVSSDELIKRSIPIVKHGISSANTSTSLTSFFFSNWKTIQRDLVGEDLVSTPLVLQAINTAWKDKKSPNFIAGLSLAESLVQSMKRRLQSNVDSTDLLIGGVEASLWVAEQFAADLRNIFPKVSFIFIYKSKHEV